MSDRDHILRCLGGGTPMSGTTARFQSPDKALSWADFEERIGLLGGRLATRQDLESLQQKRAWVDPDAEEFLSGLALPRTPNIWEAEIGFTTAECAVAESGSLLLSAGSGRTRMASLAPPLHVAFVSEDRLVSTIDEALAQLSDRTSVLVTGSSRTADIEGVLVRGVHGPREVWVVRV